MKIGVAGFGVVGSAMARMLRPAHEISIYDKFLPPWNSASCREEVNRADLVFLCVPTPRTPGGNACDVSAIEECVRWIEPPVCIRSTIPPGTTERLAGETGRALAFSPEYLGENPSHPWHEASDCGFLIVGGDPRACVLTAAAYREAFDGRELLIHRTDARTAELCKYMENCFLAMKVAFVNQFWDIARELEVDFEELRTLWLADPRVGESHTRVAPERGFGGRCLPKDLAAIIALMSARGGAPLLDALLQYNEAIRQPAAAAISA